MIAIPNQTDLAPYVRLARQAAQESPCLRRQYGAVIVYSGPDIDQIVAHNERLSDCCYGKSCVRNNFQHGQSVEQGAEIHAETAALIKAGRKRKGDYFILAGYKQGKPLYGTDSLPCHVCALNIKYAGYKNIYIMADETTLRPVNINWIIRYREDEWND